MTAARKDPPAASASDDERILIAGRDVVDLIGRRSFTEVMLLALDKAEPTPEKVQVVDAVLVAMMDHGITPSSLVTRTVLDGAPEAPVAAVAAGLLAIGSRFLGTIAEAAGFLQRIVASASGGDLQSAAESEIERIVADRQRIPGIGHNLHSLEDPRVVRLLDVTRSHGLDGRHVEAFELVPQVAEAITGKRLLPNAAGAIGAILSDIGYPPETVGGFATVARCAGLVSHVAEERETPIARRIWQQANVDHGRHP